jgi:succinyl-diaminopimelate desuccinylase
MNDIKDSIRIASVFDEKHCSDKHPLGENMTEALEHFLSRAAALGFRTKNVGNMAGFAEIGDGKEIFGILGHLDVVPAGRLEEWTHLPFEGVIDESRIFGRGAIDDKGPVFSCLYAMKALIASGTPIGKRIRLIVGLDEENDLRCMDRYRETEEIPHMSFSPDASFPVVNAEKGLLKFYVHNRIAADVSRNGKRLLSISGGTRFNLVPDEAKAVFADETITAGGKSAHAMEPEKGENAIEALIEKICAFDFSPHKLRDGLKAFLPRLRDTINGADRGEIYRDEISGQITQNLGVISFEGEKISLGFDIRYPVTADGEKLINHIAETVRNAGWIFELVENDPPLYVPEDSELVMNLLKSYSDITGDAGRALSMGGGTYSRTLANAVSFGPLFPNEEETAHQADEHINLESLRKMTLIYASTLASLAGKKIG